ncbi:MAG: type II secretion system F family protein [Sedimentisphaerales bacterium]|nr:type II secretion system F family protein [Sedimentisphaerales bacterium]
MKPTPADDQSSEPVGRVKTRDLAVATGQLAGLLEAGLPLVSALTVLAEQLESRTLSRLINELCDRVNAGTDLAGALEAYPTVFEPLYVNMVRAAQASGTLEQVLRRLAAMLEKRARLAGKVKAALAYPLFMTVFSLGVVIFLMALVVPSLTRIFLEMKRELPLPTRILIGASTVMQQYLIFVVLGMCLLVLAAVAYRRSERGRLRWDTVKLKLPLIGRLYLRLESARLARTLAVLLASGIGILEALELARQIIQNRFLAECLGRVRRDVSRGEGLARSLRNAGAFGPLLYHAAAIGESSGSLDVQLSKVADIYDEQVETAGRCLTSLLEPAVLLGMGLVVGFIVLAILLPIFEIHQML